MATIKEASEKFDLLTGYSLEALAKAKKKSKKKLDPKAKDRNRGKCIFPAESSKVNDHKDHYPINNEDQARAALRYAGKQKSAPWYNGTVEQMQKAVERAVHNAYPGIGKEEKKTKKSAIELIIEKYSAKQ